MPLHKKLYGRIEHKEPQNSVLSTFWGFLCSQTFIWERYCVFVCI